MKKQWQAIGITVAAAALLYYPALKLYQYIAKKRAEGNEESEDHVVKAFAPAYRGKHKPHQRHTHNGQAGPDVA
jgi:hypothetical protein